MQDFFSPFLISHEAEVDELAHVVIPSVQQIVKQFDAVVGLAHWRKTLNQTPTTMTIMTFWKR